MIRVVVDFLFEVFFVKEDLVVIEFEGKMIGSMDWFMIEFIEEIGCIEVIRFFFFNEIEKSIKNF